MSTAALDVALSRGGNQIVINNYGSHMDFIGGNAETKIKKRTVKIKVWADYDPACTGIIEGN